MSQAVRQLFDRCVELFRSSDGAEQSSLHEHNQFKEHVYILLLERRDGTYAQLEYYEGSKMFCVQLADDKDTFVFVNREQEIHSQPDALVERIKRAVKDAQPYPPAEYLYWYYKGTGKSRFCQSSLGSLP